MAEHNGAMPQEDYRAVRLMLECGALTPLSLEQLPKSGSAKILCGDGDETPQAVANLVDIALKVNGAKTCSHIITVDGGPGGGSPNAPFRALMYRDQTVCQNDLFILARLEGVRRIKGNRVRNVFYIPHCSCGMCNLHNVRIWQNLFLCYDTKDMARRELNGEFTHHRIVPLLNFSGYPEEVDGVQQLFVVRRRPFEKLASQQGWG